MHPTKRLFIPDVDALRATILGEYHDPACAGHLGRDKTLEAVTRHYYWPGISRDVAEYVSTCPECQAVKASTQHPAGLLHPLPPATVKWEWITMDLVTALPMSDLGHDSIFTVVDRCTKMAHFIPTTSDADAADLAELFMTHVFRHHGLPKHIVSDRDGRFVGKFWRALFALLGTQLKFSTAFHPQTDGQSERANRTVADMLRCTCADMPQAWDKRLPMVEFAYNNSVSSSTGFSPFYLQSGFHPAIPASLAVGMGTGGVAVPVAGAPSTGENPAATALVDHMTKTLEKANANLQQSVQRQKQYADRHRRHVSYHVGDYVLLSTDNLHLPSSSLQRKLKARFVGPFRVQDILSDVHLRLELPASWKIHPVFHVSLLRLYRTSTKFPASRRAGRRPAPPVMVDGHEEFIVERFLAARQHYGRQQYLVQWRGYPLHDAEWLFADDLQDDLDPATYRRLCRNVP